MEESGRTTAARTPLVPTSTANTLTLISSRYPLGQPFLDGGNATIRGGEGQVLNAGLPADGSTMPR